MTTDRQAVLDALADALPQVAAEFPPGPGRDAALRRALACAADPDFAGGEGTADFAVRHAPHDMVIAGKPFRGGQFIPSEDYADATPEQKAAVEGAAPPPGEAPAPPSGEAPGPPPRRPNAELMLSRKSERHAAALEAHRRAKAGLEEAVRRKGEAKGWDDYRAAADLCAAAAATEKAAREKAGEEARLDFASMFRSDRPARFGLAYGDGTRFPAALKGRAHKVATFLSGVCDGGAHAHGRSGEERVHVERTRTGREYYLLSSVHLHNKSEEPVIAHEIAHHIEDKSKDAQAAVAEWVARRFGDEPPVSLGEKFPGHGFEADERGRADDLHGLFPHDPAQAYYVGKPYPGGAGTEVVSMGVELLYRDPRFFAETDPDYFELIVGILQPGRRP